MENVEKMSCRIDILHHIVPVSPGDKLKIIAVNGVALTCENPKKFLTLKILLGDTSDNIPSVPGVGKATAKKLSEDEKMLESFLENNLAAKERYTKNKNLIDFDMIPDEICNSIHEMTADFLPTKQSEKIFKDIAITSFFPHKD